MPREKLSYVEDIGQGEFGRVFKAKIIEDGNTSNFVAVKMLKGENFMLKINNFSH